MIEIPSHIALLTLEALAALFLALAVVAARAVRRRSCEDRQTGRLVERLCRERDPLALKLSENLATAGHQGEADDLAETVVTRERGLYRCAIEAFMTRDGAKLEQLDRHVHALSEPYRLALEALLGRLQEGNSAEMQIQVKEQGERIRDVESENQALRQRAERLTGEIQALQQQLAKMAADRDQLRQEFQKLMASLEEVSAEYTRVFHGSSDGQLEAGRLRMLRYFRRAAGLTDDGHPGEEPPT